MLQKRILDNTIGDILFQRPLGGIWSQTFDGPHGKGLIPKDIISLGTESTAAAEGDGLRSFSV